MSTLPEDLRSKLLADSDIATAVGTGRVHYQRVPQSYLGDYVWFSRSGSSDDEDRELAQNPGQLYQFRELFDVEAISQVLDDSEALTRYVKRLDNTRGAFGDGTIQALFVRDHTEDYVPRGVMGDEGSFVGALQLEIIGYVPGS